MTEAEASAILLVRAVEEGDPSAVAPDTWTDALRAAGDPTDAGPWFTRRARYVLAGLPATPHVLLRLTSAPDQWGWFIFAGALVLGLASNYLGPIAKIHVLFNPLLLLVAWNLMVYSLSIGHASYRWYRKTHTAPRAAPQPNSTPAGTQTDHRTTSSASGAPRAQRSKKLPWALRIVFPALWLRWQRWTARYEQAHGVKTEMGHLGVIARRFWTYWSAAASPLILTRLRRVLHYGAIGLALGAVAGMYVRGLFLEYNVVWRSTFIRDEDIITLLLQVLFVPATLLSGWSVGKDLGVTQLMHPAGAPAAPWIHLYALTALALVMLPRAAAAVMDSFRIRRLLYRVSIDLHEDYYQRLIEPARQWQLQRLLEEIQTAVRIEYATFSEAIALFVCEQLYDRQVAPALRDFQQHGGKIADLETRVRETCEAFEPALVSQVRTAQTDFERALAVQIRHAVGNIIIPPPTLDEAIVNVPNPPKESTPLRPGHALVYGFTDAISAVVSTAVAMVAGTVSGGFGNSLGLAIITTVLGTTGPIGFVLGALLGLAAAAVGWRLGRERLATAIKGITLPSAVTGMILWTSHLDRLIAEGRTQCHTSIKERLDTELGPMLPRIVEHIWRSLTPLLRDLRPT